MGWSYTHVWEIKIRRDISGERGPSPILHSPAQGSSARKMSPWFLAVKPSRDWSCGRQNLLKPQAVPLKKPMHRLIWIHSLWAPVWGQHIERQQRHKGRNWIVWHQGESWGTAFSQTEVLADAIVTFLSRPPTEPQTSRWVPYLRLHQPGSHCLPHPGNLVGPAPPNFQTHPSCFQGFSTWMACLGPGFRFS